MSTGATGGVRSDARQAVDEVARKFVEPEAPVGTAAAPAAREPVIGDRVIVGGLGLEGVVTGVHDGQADVDVRGKRMRTSVHDLRIVGAAAPVGAAKVNVHVELQPRETTPADLNVIGCTVDEALARAERFLDASLLTDQRTVRIIHGHGTGQLRRGIASYLQQHPLVASFQAAPPEQGGGGVTVVELKD